MIKMAFIEVFCIRVAESSRHNKMIYLHVNFNSISLVVLMRQLSKSSHTLL